MFEVIRRSALGIAAGTAGTLTLQGATIVEWTFEDPTTPADATNVAVYPNNISPVVGTGIAGGVHTSGNTDWTSPVGNGSPDSFSSNDWAVGDYYQFNLSTTGFESIQLTWDQTRSGTGPATFDLAYSTDGINFSIYAPADNYTVNVITWSATSPQPASTFTFDLSSISAINNQQDLFVRLIADAAGAATGTSRVDNFKVEGTALLVPGRYWDANGGPGVGGTGIWNAINTNWNTAANGSGTPVSITPADRAIFSGTAGTVTIDAAGVTANGGLTFETAQYTIAGPGVLTLGTGAIATEHVTGVTTIAAVIQGTQGLTKAGVGTLVLSGTNTFTGEVRLNDGVLRIDRPENLGDSANDLVFAGGTLNPTVSLTLGAQRSLTGSGKLDIPTGTTLTVQGDVNMTGLELLSPGTFAPTGALTQIGALTVRSATTIANSGPIGLGALTTTQTDGTVTINGPVIFSANGTRNVDVTDSTAPVDLAILGDLTLSGITGAAKLFKTGPGTLDLLGANNSALNGVRLGTADGPMTGGGRLIIHNRDSLGLNQFQFNNGILEVASPLTGANAIPSTVSLSVGGGSSLGDTSSSVITGSPIQFAGDISLFNNTNGGYASALTLNTAVTIDGIFGTTPGTSGMNFTLLGTGSLTLTNAGPHTLNEPIVLNGPSFTVVSGSLSALTAGIEVQKGRLAGSVNLAGALGVGDGTGIDDAIVSPGVGIGLIDAAILTLGSDAVFKLELDSNLGTADKIRTLGSVSLGSGTAKLDASDLANAVLPVPLTLTIIENASPDSTTGFFEGLPDGGSILIGSNLFRIEYDFGPDLNDVALVLIPEPSAVTGLLLGTSLLGLRRKRPAIH